MDSIHKLETTLATWYKHVPFHLPENARKWIATNVWWIVLVGVIVGAFGIFTAVTGLMAADQILSQYGAYNNYYAGQGAFSSVNTAGLWVGLALSAAVLVVEAMAIQPLKAGSKRGWDFLFFGLLLSALSSVVSAVMFMSPFSLVSSALGLVIGGYFLFEIHAHYLKTSSGTRAKTKS